MTTSPPGSIITFYSYKSDTGRSMILANIAWILASQGKRVLVVDWNLEAPGLHRYFFPFLPEEDLRHRKGLIDFLINFRDEKDNISQYIIPLEWSFPGNGCIHFVQAGLKELSYTIRASSFNWEDLYKSINNRIFLEEFKNSMRGQYDYSLLDSRTGLSDIHGICTVHMPDTLVTFFTANNQSIMGAFNIASSVDRQWIYYGKHTNQKRKIYPVLARVERAEQEKLDMVRAHIREIFSRFLEHMPEKDIAKYWEVVEIPYIPWYAYEEVLSTFRDNPKQRDSLLVAIEELTYFITDKEISQLQPPTTEQRLEILSKFQQRPTPNDLPPTPNIVSQTYSVLFCYNDDDRETVQKIAVFLEDKAKLPVWFDQWFFTPGLSWEEKLERGLSVSSSCAVFVGRSGAGPWQVPEIETMLRKRLQDKSFRLIPVALPEAPSCPELPAFLAGNKWVDLRRAPEDIDALRRLESEIRGLAHHVDELEPALEQQPLSTEEREFLVGSWDGDIPTAANPVNVFISYSHHQERDFSLAHTFRDALQQAGHTVFIDTDIPWGEEWSQHIPKALDKADYLLLLISPESMASSMVTEEVTRAKELSSQRDGYPVILPIRVCFPADKPLPYNIAGYLRTIQHEYWNTPDDTARLVNSLLTRLDDAPSSSTETSGLSSAENERRQDSQENPVQVFISCGHQEQDNALSNKLSEAFQQQGHHVFISTGIRWGTDRMQVVSAPLERFDYLVVLLSRETAASERITEEIARAKELAAQRNGRPVIVPIRVCFPLQEPLPYYISVYLQSIYQELWTNHDDTARLVDRLLHTVNHRKDWSADTQNYSISGSAQYLTAPPHFDPRDMILPGGAINMSSRFYILREADENVLNALRHPRALVAVRGPRQTGKTSLIMRVYAALRGIESQVRTVFVDFQALSLDELQSLDTIWRTIAIYISEQFQLDNWEATSWQLDRDHAHQFSRFLDEEVFDKDETPLLICLDEVDRVFNTPIKTDFFASIRSNYNRGAMDPIWQKVRWLFGTSSEPSFFIEDLTQSPFNIGLQVELSTFTPKEVTTFSQRYGLTLQQEDIAQIMDYVGGRPYLVHLLLQNLAQNPDTREQLFDAHADGGGIFQDHLSRYLFRFQQDQDIAGAMKDIVMGIGCKDLRIVERLRAAGLVRRDENQNIVPTCQLYTDFFRKELHR